MSQTTNSRYDPFIDDYVLAPLTETHIIGLITELGIYGIRLYESPFKDVPSTVIATGVGTGAPSYTEVSFSTAPGANQFRVDYGDLGKETGLMQFNSANNGMTVSVDYFGKGSILSEENISEVAAVAIKVIKKMDVFTSSGTWTRPDGVTSIKVTVIGGGGGGAGSGGIHAGGGGGGGGISIKFISALGATEAITIGSGGGGGAGSGGSAANGTGGGQTFFGAHFNATGGAGGIASGGIGGASGIGSSGDINDSLGDGHTSINTGVGGDPGQDYGGHGGGPGGIGGFATTGGAAPGYGGGGGGGGDSNAGGTGKGGIVIIEYDTIEAI